MDRDPEALLGRNVLLLALFGEHLVDVVRWLPIAYMTACGPETPGEGEWVVTHAWSLVVGKMRVVDCGRCPCCALFLVCMSRGGGC